VQVLLVHNPGAGTSQTGGSELLDLLRDAGHDATHVSTGDEGWRHEVRRGEADLVAVAGGDGTVQLVFTALEGTGATVGVIATGTANNIAHTLGTPVDDPAAAVAVWGGASSQPFDLPQVRCAARRGPLVECVGGGVFAELLTVAEEREERLGADGDTQDGLRLLRGVLRDQRPGRWQVEVDGQDLSGEYLAVVAMNIRRLGPNVELAPGARPGDGLLDVVLVGEEQRSDLIDYVDHLMATGTPGRPADAPRLPTHRGAAVRAVAPKDVRLHVDDERFEACADDQGGQVVEVQVDDTALQVLVP
jgi:diacylglycerol kinase (ATP)